MSRAAYWAARQHPARQLDKLLLIALAVQIAEEYDFLIVDDASYADLRPADHCRWTPLAMLDRLKRTIHVGSFSRVATPALGVGYLAANGETMNALLPYRPVHSLSMNLLPQRALYVLLEDGEYDRRQRILRTQVERSRRDLIRRWAEAGMLLPDPTAAGPYLWLPLGENTDAPTVAAMMAKADYVMADHALFGSDDVSRRFVRLNVTTTSAEAMDLLVSHLSQFS